jgi:hypothetical protein
LGENVEGAPSIVEALLNYPGPLPEIVPPAEDYVRAKEDFLAKRSSIEAILWQQGQRIDISFPFLEIANFNLYQNILAALELGDMGYLSIEIKWIKGLLANLSLPADSLKRYLSAYAHALQEELGAPGELISTHLDQLARMV